MPVNNIPVYNVNTKTAGVMIHSGLSVTEMQKSLRNGVLYVLAWVAWVVWKQAKDISLVNNSSVLT